MAAKPKKTKKLPGPKSSYTEALGEQICTLIANGETDGTIEKMPGMPSADTIRRWRVANEAFGGLYMRAREDRADFRANRIDTYVKNTISGKLKPDAARVAIDAEKWLAGKEQPKRYGDKVDVNLDASEAFANLWKLVGSGDK